MLAIVAQSFIFLSTLVSCRQGTHASVQNRISFFSYLLYALVTGCRWETGTDWIPYQELFAYAISGDTSQVGETFEKGFVLLNIAFSSIFPFYSGFLLFESTLIAVIVWRIARKFSINPAALLCFFALSQSQLWYPVRQQLAIALAAYGASLLITPGKIRKTWMAGGIYACAASIHVSSLIMVISMLVRKAISILFKSGRGLALAILCFMLIAYAYQHFSDLAFLQARYSTYVEDNDYDGSSTRLAIRVADRLISVIFALYLCVSYRRKDNEIVTRSLLEFAIFGAVIYISALVSFPFLTRIALYFSWADAVIVSYFVTIRKSLRPRGRIILGLWIILVWIRFVSSFLSYWDLLNPYYLFFEDFSRDLY